MKIVLAVDPIRRPLTGIGKYTWELASRLPAAPDITDVKFLAHGRWRSFAALEKNILFQNDEDNFLKVTALRRKIFRNRVVRGVYAMAANALTQVKLSFADDYLFHGPNYLLPKNVSTGIITVHDLSTFKDPNWHPTVRRKYINKILPDSIERATLVLTDSNAIKKELHHYFNLADNKVIAIPLGVDPIFHARDEAKTQKTLAKYDVVYKKYVLCVATIEPRKNILRLISAYNRLPSNLTQQYPLLLIGEPGWNSSKIHQEIASAQRKGWLKYVGFVPDQELPEIYAGTRLFVYPSLYEGFGLPIVEAMASGVATLTSNCASMPEVANGAARLINPEDENDLYQSLLFCLQDEVWQQQSIKRGLEQAATLTWEKCALQTIAAYHLALGSR